MLIECACAVCHGAIPYPAMGLDERRHSGVSPVTCSENCRQIWSRYLRYGQELKGMRYHNLRTVNEYRHRMEADRETLARWMETHGITPIDPDAEQDERQRLRLTWCRKYRPAPLIALKRWHIRPRRVGNVVDLASAFKSLSVSAHGL